MPRRVTKRQMAVMRFIHDYTRANDLPPTLREIAGALGVRSTNGVMDHLLALERKGLVRPRRDAKSRDLHLTDDALEYFGGARPRPQVRIQYQDDAWELIICLPNGREHVALYSAIDVRRVWRKQFEAAGFDVAEVA